MKSMKYIIPIFLIFSVAGVNMNTESSFDSIPGKYLRAWNVCFNDFMKIKDMSTEEKDLLNYNISFNENASEIIVYFVPKILPEKIAKKLNRMVLGREVEYIINKSNFKIVNRNFYKA